jgi:hypothetical protein
MDTKRQRISGATALCLIFVLSDSGQASADNVADLLTSIKDKLNLPRKG